MSKVIAVVAACLLLAVCIYLLLLLGRGIQEEKEACIQSGGTVNEYNCGQYGCHDWQCVHR